MFIINVFTTPDHFQDYIPMFAYCMRKLYPDIRADIGVMGDISESTYKGLSFVENSFVRAHGDEYIPVGEGVVVSGNVLTNIPIKESTANTLRYLAFLKEDFEGCLITDIDLLHLDGGVIPWMQQQAGMLSNGTYYAHHGPWKKPNRFPGKSWKGDYERLSGGAIWITKEWLIKSEHSRKHYFNLLEKGEIGTYREEDEVVFCRICKAAGLPIPQSKYYPPEYRGIHLGDFKDSMTHRWTNADKMRQKLTTANARKFMSLVQEDETFQHIVAQIPEESPVNKILTNALEHCKKR